MGITSRKAVTLFSQDTLEFAANHKAKSESSGRPRKGRSRCAFSSPQPSQDRTARQTTDRRQRAGNWRAMSSGGRVKLPCPPIEGDPATVTWAQFRETYATLAEAVYAKPTMSEWRKAESMLDEEFEPKRPRDLTPEMLEAFEEFVYQAGYSQHRMEGFASRLHQMILWGCECGYMDRNAFGIGPDFKWPPKAKHTWTNKLAAREADAPAKSVWAQRLGEAVA